MSKKLKFSSIEAACNYGSENTFTAYMEVLPDTKTEVKPVAQGYDANHNEVFYTYRTGDEYTVSICGRRCKKNISAEALLIANEIVDKRKAKGLTLDDMMRLTGLNRQTCIKVEKGDAYNFSSLIAYAKALQMKTITLDLVY